LGYLYPRTPAISQTRKKTKQTDPIALFYALSDLCLTLYRAKTATPAAKTRPAKLEATVWTAAPVAAAGPVLCVEDAEEVVVVRRVGAVELPEAEALVVTTAEVAARDGVVR
jgi:hypothetical protein